MTARPEPMPYDSKDVVQELAMRNAGLVLDVAVMTAQLKTAHARIEELEAKRNSRPKRAPAKPPKKGAKVTG